MTKKNTSEETLKQQTFSNSSNDDLPKCPSCGSTKYHRTERTTMERMLKRPPMARCEKCGKRFAYVKHPDEAKAPSTASEQTQPGGDQGNAAADSSNQEVSSCPFCGSTHYRRSRRSAAERLLMRPKMARCSHCRKRFPLPES